MKLDLCIGVFNTYAHIYFLLQNADIGSDIQMAKKLKRTLSDSFQDVANGEELSLYATTPNNSESVQVNLEPGLCFYNLLLCKSLVQL